MTTFQNQVVVVLGRKGTGKSELLYQLYVSTAPRVLTIGTLRQDLERDPKVIVVLGMDRLVKVLSTANGKWPRWHIAAALEPDDLVELCRMLAPPIGSTEPSLSESFGGMALECSEAYELAPNGRTADDVLSLWRRGRHYGLDLFMASQRPSSCAREVTAQADLIYAFAQSEPRDLKFIADSISGPVADRVAVLGRYECIRFDRGEGVATVLDRNRRVVGQLTTMGAAVA